MAKDGWGTTNDEGTIIFIDRTRQSKNGPFTIIKLRNKATDQISRIQMWDQGYKTLKNEIYYVGSNVSVAGWVHYYIDEDGTKQVRVKSDHILPLDGTCRPNTIKMRLIVTSEWYKGESHGKEIHGFSGKAVHGDEKVTESLVVRCYMPRVNPLWKLIKKGTIIDIEGTYSIEEDETGSRIVINDIQFIKEVKGVQYSC